MTSKERFEDLDDDLKAVYRELARSLLLALARIDIERYHDKKAAVTEAETHAKTIGRINGFGSGVIMGISGTLFFGLICWLVGRIPG